MIHPLAVTSIQTSIRDQLAKCFGDECDRYTIDTKVRPPHCDPPSFAIQIVRDRVDVLTKRDAPGHCFTRKQVRFLVVVDIPTCPLDELGVKSVAEAEADAANINEITSNMVTHVAWLAASGGIAGDCQNVAVGDMECVDAGVCHERWQMPITVDVTGWCPPGADENDPARYVKGPDNG